MQRVSRVVVGDGMSDGRGSGACVVLDLTQAAAT